MIALVRNTKKTNPFLFSFRCLPRRFGIDYTYLAIRMYAMRAGWGSEKGETLKRAPIAFSHPLIPPVKIPACHAG